MDTDPLAARPDEPRPQHPVDPGPVGIWSGFLDPRPADEARRLAAEIEQLGYGALWVPEAVGREPLVNSAMLLAATERLVLATGIASIYARGPMAANAGLRTLTEAFPGRFMLGLGVSHQPMVEGLMGLAYDKPLAAMGKYLDAMDAALFFGARPPHEPQRVLAALAPRMLGLAGTRTNGALSYFVPLEHTPVARADLGPDGLLCVEQAVVLETDPARARELARSHTSTYVNLPNYTNNLRRFGFGDEDFVDRGSDRLIDAIVAWGDDDAVAARARAHLDAGADHVCIQVIADDHAPGVEQWRRLAPLLAT
jgi:probable F420-dependent oxidoreductase